MTNKMQVLHFYFSKVFGDLTELNGFYFSVKEIRILFDFCTEDKPKCKEPLMFLEEFSKEINSNRCTDRSAHGKCICLAHLLTYRDFPGGYQGLAFNKAVCAKKNVGFTTVLNHQVLNLKMGCSNLRDSGSVP